MISDHLKELDFLINKAHNMLSHLQQQFTDQEYKTAKNFLDEEIRYYVNHIKQETARLTNPEER